MRLKPRYQKGVIKRLNTVRDREGLLYAYCFNNPLIYTDESGEIFGSIFGAVGGFFRGISRVFRGENFFDIFTYTWKGFANGAKIEAGWFTGNIHQIVSRFTKELPQSIAGNLWSTYRNTIGHVDKVRYYEGATYVINGSSAKNDGISIGSYININIKARYDKNKYEPNGKFTPTADPLFMHEYGHYLQSQDLGWKYLTKVGLPSIKSAKNSKRIEGDGIDNPDRITTHGVTWYERDANRRASHYFSTKGVDWGTEPFYKYPIDYPRFDGSHDYVYSFKRYLYRGEIRNRITY